MVVSMHIDSKKRLQKHKDWIVPQARVYSQCEIEQYAMHHKKIVLQKIKKQCK